MTTNRLPATFSACWCLLAFVGGAAESAAPEKTGLAVGQEAPGFTLKDQDDHEVSLATLLKKGPVALVFHRSADW